MDGKFIYDSKKSPHEINFEEYYFSIGLFMDSETVTPHTFDPAVKFLFDLRWFSFNQGLFCIKRILTNHPSFLKWMEEDALLQFISILP